MRKNKRNTLLGAVLAMVLTVSLAACTGSQTSDQAANTVDNKTAVSGTILLSVNPEIEVEYDDQGMVLEIEGVNDDGKTIVADYEGYKGKECAAVVNELVQKIYESGYFEKQLDGRVKNIVVKMEDGSAYPDDDFLEEVVEGVRNAIDKCGVKSSAMVVDDDDLDDKGRIGIEKARELVLAQLGLTEAQFSEREYELDDGVYELEFTANGVEYEYELDAFTGKVLEADFENNDDWDDDAKDDDLDDDDKDDDIDDRDDNDKDDDLDDRDDDDKDDDIDDRDDDDKDDDIDDRDDDDKDDDIDDRDDDDKDDDRDDVTDDLDDDDIDD